MLNNFLTLFFIFTITGCSSVVEPIKIADLSPDTTLQENFSIKLMPLTFDTAKDLNAQPFPRFLSQPGNQFSAKLINVQDIEQNQFPPDEGRFSYLLGVGDVINFVQSKETSGPTINSSEITVPETLNASPAFTSLGAERVPVTSPAGSTTSIGITSPSSSIMSTKGRIGSDGSLILIGVGRLEAKGRNLNDLRNEVKAILIQTGQTTDFQLEIEGFNSQKAFITTDSPPDEKPDQIKYVLPITDQALSLREILATAGVAFNEKVFTIVKIQRNGKTYAFSLAALFSESAPQVFLKDQDHVFIQNLEYVKGKVFLVGGVKPQLLEIQPELRQTLAEVLFAKGGPLEEQSAQRSAVYLLRGNSPVSAYHLDAQNPARILVADALEMRPDDIVYVAEQPINTFNRVLETILPLRLFSRDAKNDNLP